MVLDRKAPITLVSVMLGSSLHYRERAPDVPTEGFFGLLPIVLEVPWVSRVLVCALEVSHEDLLQVHPALDSVGRKVFQPRSCRIGQEQWKVVDNEIFIIRPTSLASKPIILEP